MATTVILSRPIKRGNVRTFDDEYNRGFTDIWASEVDAEFDNLYGAWNNELNASRVTISPSPPTGPVIGDLWWRDTDGNLFVYYDDGNSQQWVPAVSAAQFVGTGLPTGAVPAGQGDLTGSYPAPIVAPGKITGGPGGKIAAGTITDLDINDVAWSKVTGKPTSFPPSGPAGGALTGTYPNPGVAYSGITGVPTSLPPSGPASGSLTGTYPSPSIGNGQVTDPMIVAMAYSKLTGAPATLPGPPTGAAGGSLAGTYPNPTFAVGSSVQNITSWTTQGVSNPFGMSETIVFQAGPWQPKTIPKWMGMAVIHGTFGIASSGPACGVGSFFRFGGTNGNNDGTVMSTVNFNNCVSLNDTVHVPFTITHLFWGGAQSFGNLAYLKITAWCLGAQVGPTQVNSATIVIYEPT